MMKLNRTKCPRALRIRRTLLKIGLALVLLGVICIGPANKTEATSLFFCVTDNITHDFVLFGPNGTYTFFQCSTGFSLPGTGVFSMPSGVATVTDRKPDRSVKAGLNTATGTGSAAIYFIAIPGGPAQVFRINETIPFAPCPCAG
jgi:hypothetical protein